MKTSVLLETSPSRRGQWLALGLAVGLGSLVGKSNSLVIAGSTLVVAALFRPARRRIQGFIDRRFYRRKYDAARTLETFSARLRQEVDLDALEGHLVSVVHDTIPVTPEEWRWVGVDHPGLVPVDADRRGCARAGRTSLARSHDRSTWSSTRRGRNVLRRRSRACGASRRRRSAAWRRSASPSSWDRSTHARGTGGCRPAQAP